VLREPRGLLASDVGERRVIPAFVHALVISAGTAMSKEHQSPRAHPEMIAEQRVEQLQPDAEASVRSFDGARGLASGT
jgi:hypothetical protein